MAQDSDLVRKLLHVPGLFSHQLRPRQHHSDKSANIDAAKDLPVSALAQFFVSA